MKVLITGGSGFIGRRLAELLVEGGASVSVWDLASPGSAAMDYRAVDVLDAASVVESLADTDVIYHLAGPVAHAAAERPNSTHSLKRQTPLSLDG